MELFSPFGIIGFLTCRETQRRLFRFRNKSPFRRRAHNQLVWRQLKDAPDADTSLCPPPDRVVITTCFGDISFDHVLESLQALAGDPSFKPGFRQLVDLSQVSKLRLRLKDLEEIQHSWDPFSNTGKRAMFATQPPDFLACENLPVARGPD